MTRFRGRGNLDDPILTDGDNGWLGMETRRHPTQLEPGIARFFQNKRLENNVPRDRKGIDRITPDLFIESNPLILPFDLGTPISVTSITRSGSTATVTLATTPATAYETGDTVEIEGANEGAYNGEFVITVTSPTVFTYTVVGIPTTPATGTITATNHPVLEDTPDGGFSSVLFSDVETNKDYIALATRDNVDLINPDDPLNPISIEYPGTEQVEVTDIMSLEQANNGIVISRGPIKKALEWDGNLFNTDQIDVVSITRVSTVATVTTQGEHKYVNGDTILIAGANESDYNGQFIVTITGEEEFEYFVAGTPTTPATGTITATKVPQFVLIGDPSVATLAGMPQASFAVYHPLARLAVPVENLILDITSITRDGSEVTVTTAINHGLVISDRIIIESADDPGYNGTFEVTSSTAVTFTYQVKGNPVTPDTSSDSVIRIAVRDQFILSDLFDHRTYDPVINAFRINRGFRDFLVGLLNFQNDNLIALYRNSINLVTGLSLPTLENSSIFQITDEVGCIARRSAVVIGERLLFLSEQGVYSLIITPQINLKGQDVPLSLDIEDDMENINWNFASDAVAVYFNNRYYIAVPEGERNIKNDTVTTDGATVTVNTQTNHNFNEADPITLSGMTPAGFNGEFNITLVDRNTYTYSNATAGPITVVGLSTKAASTRNNIVFIYNFLNKKWESKDTFGAEGSFIDNFVVANLNGKKRLFATSLEGAVQLFEELDIDKIGPVGGPFADVEIAGQIITRRYTMKQTSLLQTNSLTFDIKRFMKGSADFESLAGDSVEITTTSENPDATSISASYTFTDENDHFRNFRINKRGRGCEIQIDTISGRPVVRKITIQGTAFQRANKEFS